MILAKPSELTREMIEFIASSDYADTSGNTVEDILELAKRGEAQIWVHLSKGAQGIIITEIRTFKITQQHTWIMAKELFVWRFAGPGMLSVFEEVDDELEAMARKIGAIRLRTFSQNHLYPEMQERMEKQRWNTVAVEMTKEIKHG